MHGFISAWSHAIDGFYNMLLLILGNHNINWIKLSYEFFSALDVNGSTLFNVATQ